MPFSFKRFLTTVSAYLRYRGRAVDEHSVHSPFVFSLLTQSLYKKETSPVFRKIEDIRKQLLHDRRFINTVDLGAGSNYDGKQISRTVAQTAAWFAKSPKYCRTLYRMISHLRPGIMIELGTSLGISAMYQSAGNPEGVLYTLEGCQETARIAGENFRQTGFGKIIVRTGNFDDTLPELLDELKTVDYAFVDGNHTYEATIRYFHWLKKKANDNSFIIFDDINWSEGMQQAWSEIKSDTDVTITLDFFAFGVVFFNKGFSKQDFVLKLR